MNQTIRILPLQMATTANGPTWATAAGGSGRDTRPIDMTVANKLACANCSRPFAPEPQAPHKRFCSAKCRTEWHARRQRDAKQLLSRLEQEELLKHDNQGEHQP